VWRQFDGFRVKILVVAIERSGKLHEAVGFTGSGWPDVRGRHRGWHGSGRRHQRPGGPVFQPGGPMLRPAGYGNNYPTVSINWSGYADLSKTPFNYVHATFVQPSVKCPGVKYQWTSNWVGLDGYNNQTVEQDGTFGRCGGPNNTTPEYYAWYEMYPGPSANVFPVHAGDIIDISVTYTKGKFDLTVSDLTTGDSTTKVAASKTAQRSSAEWIIERPALCNSTGSKCFLTELANFRSTSMSGAWASVDGGKVKSIGGFNNYPIYMFDPVKRGLISLDTVSQFSGPSFTATWDRSGTITPIQLGPRR
jgi:Peptidase A4 family